MHKFLLACLVFALPILAIAQYPGYKPVGDLVAFSGRFTAASRQLQSVKSDFIQEKNLSLLADKISSSGKFWFKKPGMVRMEYQSPFQYLVIISNNKIYMRDGQKENKISSKSNKTFQQVNQLMLDCIQGTVLANPAYQASVFEGGDYLIALSPTAAGLKEFFSHILVYVSRKDFSVTKIRMDEKSGDNTIITFTNREMNVPVADALFTIH